MYAAIVKLMKMKNKHQVTFWNGDIPCSIEEYRNANLPDLSDYYEGCRIGLPDWEWHNGAALTPDYEIEETCTRLIADTMQALEEYRND